MLAIVGIGAMVAFVFLDPLMRIMGRSRGQENPLVVQTRYGALTQSELGGLVQSRELVNIFLQQLARATVDEQIKKGQLDRRNQFQAVEQQYDFWKQTLLDRSKSGPEEAAVETLVLSKEAERAGLVVSDRAVNDLLKLITADTLDSQAIQDVIDNLHTGRRVSVARLFDALRTEMLASKYSQLFAQSLRDIPPAQRFEYYARLNRRAQCEVMPLAVADFTGQVKNPSDEELRKFYEDNKNRFPDPASPEPGFKQPKKAVFQYFKADFAKFKEECKPQVTETEIQEYYDKNKSQFRAVETPPEKEEAKSGTATPEESGKDTPQEPSKPEGDKPADAKDKPADAKDKPADAKDKPADAKGEPAEPEKTEKPADEQSPQATLGARREMVRLVSSTTSSEEKAEAKLADQPAGGAPPASAPDSQPAEDSKPNPPAAAGKADAEPADETTKPATDGEQPATESSDKPSEKSAPEIKYEPLEKVQDTIRDSIAGAKAREQINATMDELKAAMSRYADDVERYNTRKATDKTAKAPPPLPMAELAKSKGVEAKELPLVTADEAASEDIGEIYRLQESRFGYRAVPFAEFAFADSMPTYKPTNGEDNNGNSYLFWKTQEEAAYVPALDKIRPKVVGAWKLIKARDVARARAEEYATQARTLGKPLKEVFAAQTNLKVAETGPFSWLSIGNVPFDSSMQPQISQVEGVVDAGAAFMETVFKLSPGQVAVAMNHPENMVYVVQLIDYERPLDELRKDFAVEPAMRYLTVANRDQRKIYLAWLTDLETDAKVKWLRPHDTYSRHRASDEMPPEDMED